MGIALAVLWPVLVLEIDIRLKSVSRRGHLSDTRFRRLLLGALGGLYASEISYATSLLFRPIKLDGETRDAIVSVGLVNGCELCYGRLIPFGLPSWFCIDT